jgi:hypothetical protein
MGHRQGGRAQHQGPNRISASQPHHRRRAQAPTRGARNRNARAPQRHARAALKIQKGVAWTHKVGGPKAPAAAAKGGKAAAKKAAMHEKSEGKKERMMEYGSKKAKKKK